MSKLFWKHRAWGLGSYFLLFAAMTASTVQAQSVCLPAPRLLTTMPMGGQAGTSVDIVISGQHMEEIESLRFSHPDITAQQKLNPAGEPIPLTFTVSIPADCPSGIHEARAISRLGVSSSRVFNVSNLQEVTREKANTTLEAAAELPLNAICNAYTSSRLVDFYRFQASSGERIVIDCAAKGIDSKLNPVIILANADGEDLVVERRGGVIDYVTETAGQYVVKVHDLTYNGGKEYFYRLSLTRQPIGESVPRMAATQTVSSFSWPPVGLSNEAAMQEAEPNGSADEAQLVTLPCDIAGRFFPAADVDLYEFDAQAGEVWWVEVASERLGLPTDPALVVQKVTEKDGQQVLTDVLQLSDIASPVKVSSNGYSYDGPPYNAGSTDILGKLEIKEAGRYRIQLSDLFGGTRNDPANQYRLVVRQAQPDFAVVGWALHMTLRNGDRNALSKPIALRQGATMPIEVVAIRRDGFDGEIELMMENLPEGVTATGLKIPAGQSRGMMLITADANAPRSLNSVRFEGHASINGEQVTRPCALASMAWPVPNAWSEIPSPRLLTDVSVSVTTSEVAPVTITAVNPDNPEGVWEAVAGSQLTIPVTVETRCEFSGTKFQCKTFGEGFASNPAFDIALDKDRTEVVMDLAKLKIKPGHYSIAFYGSAVAKYCYNPNAVDDAQVALKQAEDFSAQLEKQIAALPADSPELEKLKADQKTALASVATAKKSFQAAEKLAQPKDIAEIVVSEPIRIHVTSNEKVAQQ